MGKYSWQKLLYNTFVPQPCFIVIHTAWSLSDALLPVLFTYSWLHQYPLSQNYKHHEV